MQAGREVGVIPDLQLRRGARGAQIHFLRNIQHLALIPECFTSHRGRMTVKIIR